VDWNSQIHRSNFVLELLLIAETSDVDSMMDKLFETLVEHGEQIFAASTSPKDEMHKAIEQIIKWFADNERYEECHELKKIKEKCLK
jgi:hypothetical protein